MQLFNDIGTVDGEDLVTALKIRTAEVSRGELGQLEIGSRCSVEDDHALAQRREVGGTVGIESTKKSQGV